MINIFSEEMDYFEFIDMQNEVIKDEELVEAIDRRYK